jgi:ATP-binding cassette subfamily F protein uup
LISLVGASKDFGIRTLFADLNLHIGDKERLGLIGPNGAGKSTLLKVLAGSEPLGNGERRCSPRLRVELVGQDSRITPGLTVLEQVLEGCGAKRDLLLRFNTLSDAVAAAPDNTALLSELGELSQTMDEEDAWSLEQQCREVLQKLGIGDLQRPVEDLSGGYRKRVGLASALVACPDVLLLDEPTNHLDAAAIEWLQSWLDRYPGCPRISHPRPLRARSCHPTNGGSRSGAGLERIKATTAPFLQHKAEEDASEAASAAKFRGILRRELAWLRQGPKARSTKQRARLQRIEAMREDKPSQAKGKLEMASVSRRIGKQVIEAEALGVTANGHPDGPTPTRRLQLQLQS